MSQNTCAKRKLQDGRRPDAEGGEETKKENIDKETSKKVYSDPGAGRRIEKDQKRKSQR